MGTQLIGTAQFEYDAGAGLVTVSLGTRLHNQGFGEARTRYTEESDDKSARSVITVGAAQPELSGTIRLHDDPEELRALISAGLDGFQVDYSPDNGSTVFECLLISASGVTPDKDFPAGCMENKVPLYQCTVTLRITGSTTSFDGLKALP